jgi:hypothetical protein
MANTQGKARKSEKTQFHLNHSVLCDFKVVTAELSKEVGRMLSYQDALAELMRRHRDHKGVA